MILILIILFTFVLIVVSDIVYCWNRLKCYNQAPLFIKTFDGSNSPYHPSVLFFKTPWNNFKYLLVQTPFNFKLPAKGEKYRDRYECPSISVSGDGINWEEITRNPIDILTVENFSNKDYFSDPHLVFKDNQLECWYRLTRRHGYYSNVDDVLLLRKKTKDGTHWSDREVLIDLLKGNEDKGLGKMFVSPAVLTEDGKYRMWYVDSQSLMKRNLAISISTNAQDWSDKQLCSLKGPKVNPWHIDVNKLDSVYWLVIYDYKELTLWKSENGINFNFVRLLLKPSNAIGSFYYKGLYRSCLIKTDTIYRLYFSADDMERSYIGIMEGSQPESLEIVSVNEQPFKSFFPFLRIYYKSRKRTFIFIIRLLWNKLSCS